MYAELSDFFYVWLKRTAGLVVPDLFRTSADRQGPRSRCKSSAVHGARRGPRTGRRDYREKMAAIFAECRRVLKPDGIMVLMFTHKATGAWDALTTGLIEAGFVVTASWPINTEAEGSLHIKDKSAANSTIFLVCRPRGPRSAEEEVWWEDLEPRVAKAVRARIGEFQAAGIKRRRSLPLGLRPGAGGVLAPLAGAARPARVMPVAKRKAPAGPAGRSLTPTPPRPRTRSRPPGGR